MQISRREFLKFIGTNVAALAIPAYWHDEVWMPQAWPSLSLEDLPAGIQRILVKAPWARMGPDGYLSLSGYDKNSLGKVPQAQTQFNKGRSRPHNRLYKDMPWGIVLHCMVTGRILTSPLRVTCAGSIVSARWMST